MRGRESEYGVLVGKSEGNLEDLGVDGRIILKFISRKLRGIWTESIWLRIERIGGFL
jgi:hypothetical protein